MRINGTVVPLLLLVFLTWVIFLILLIFGMLHFPVFLVPFWPSHTEPEKNEHGVLSKLSTVRKNIKYGEKVGLPFLGLRMEEVLEPRKRKVKAQAIASRIMHVGQMRLDGHL